MSQMKSRNRTGKMWKKEFVVFCDDVDKSEIGSYGTELSSKFCHFFQVRNEVQ